MNVDANMNVAQCLKTASYIGYDRVHNICNGAVTDVPWGSGDWAGAVIMGGFIAGVAVFMLAFALYAIVTTVRGY